MEIILCCSLQKRTTKLKVIRSLVKLFHALISHYLTLLTQPVEMLIENKNASVPLQQSLLLLHSSLFVIDLGSYTIICIFNRS